MAVCLSSYFRTTLDYVIPLFLWFSLYSFILKRIYKSQLAELFWGYLNFSHAFRKTSIFRKLSEIILWNKKQFVGKESHIGHCICTHIWHRTAFILHWVLRHCAAKRRLSALSDIGSYIYIYTTLKFLALQWARYIYNVSTVRVKITYTSQA
jgi:hypothetical protein